MKPKKCPENQSAVEKGEFGMNFFDHKTMGRLINLEELAESGPSDIKVYF